MMNHSGNIGGQHDCAVIVGDEISLKAAIAAACQRNPWVVPATVSAVTVPPAVVACVGLVKNVPVADIANLLMAYPLRLTLGSLRR